MRKLFFAASAGLICFFTSCNNSTNVSSASNDNPQAQKNLNASHIINDAFGTGDTSKIASAVANDFLDHTDHGEVKGRDSLNAMISMIHNSMKDMKMDMIKELADSDYVFSWMHFSGTGDGKMMPAGHYDMHAIEVAKFKDGKAVEHWEYGDMQEMAKMMGQMQGMNNKMNSMDSSKMNNK